MKRILRIFVIAVVLSTVLFISSTSHKVARACYQYIVPGSTTEFLDNNPRVTIYFSLWYDTCTGNNFTSANITSGSADVTVSVTREAVSGGLGEQTETNENCPSTGVCNSPPVYSPNNPAYAWIEAYFTGYSPAIYSSAF